MREIEVLGPRPAGIYQGEVFRNEHYYVVHPDSKKEIVFFRSNVRNGTYSIGSHSAKCEPVKTSQEDNGSYWLRGEQIQGSSWKAGDSQGPSREERGIRDFKFETFKIIIPEGLQ